MQNKAMKKAHVKRERIVAVKKEIDPEKLQLAQDRKFLKQQRHNCPVDGVSWSCGIAV